MITDGGASGWTLVDTVGNELVSPRNMFPNKYLAKCASPIDSKDWILSYNPKIKTLSLINPSLQTVLTRQLVYLQKCDFALNAANQPTIVLSSNVDDIEITWGSNTLNIVGKNPCCLFSIPPVESATELDIIVFYQKMDNLFFRLQSEDFSVEHTIPWEEDISNLATCGTTQEAEVSLQLQCSEFLSIAVGDKTVGVDDNYVGYPRGEFP